MKLTALFGIVVMTSYVVIDATKVGVGYGLVGPHKISYDAGLRILKSKGITYLKTWTVDRTFLMAVRRVYKGRNVSVTVGIPNSDLPKIIASSGYLLRLRDKLREFRDILDTVAIGNQAALSSIDSLVEPAVRRVRNSIAPSLPGVKLTAPLAGDVLTDTWPIANSRIRDPVKPAVLKLLDHLDVFSINLYPYFAYVNDPRMSLAAALGEHGSVLKNMVESVKIALAKVGKASMPIVISETGWPSAGGIGASVANQQMYKAHVYSLAGRVDRIFISSAFDEEGLSSDLDRSFGLYHSDGTEKPLITTACDIGVGYGLIGPHLVDFESGLRLLKSYGVYILKTWSIDPQWLSAVRNVYGSSAMVTVAVPNADLVKLSNDVAYGDWVASQLIQFRDIIDILAVSNEPSFNNVMHLLTPAVKAARSLIDNNKLDIDLTVPFMAGILTDTWPIENSRFVEQHLAVVTEVLGLIDVFSMNLYPYFAYVSDPHIALEDALGERGSLLKNMIMGVQVALRKVGREDMKILIGETGWPSAGGRDTTPENMKIYTNHTLSLHDLVYRIYFFEAFDEKDKPGDAVERNFGLLEADGREKFKLQLCN